MLRRHSCPNHCTCSTKKKDSRGKGRLAFCETAKNVSLKCDGILKKSCAHLARLVPATVQMRGRSRGWAENICLLCLFLSLFFILQPKSICEGLERALLRMHRSMLTLCICGILCLFTHGGGVGGWKGGRG